MVCLGMCSVAGSMSVTSQCCKVLGEFTRLVVGS
jgi:hypothetical protein